MTFARKINKIPEFYVIVTRKIFFRVFSPSPTPIGLSRRVYKKCKRMTNVTDYCVPGTTFQLSK